MGCNNSVLSEEDVSIYSELTYLTKSEIWSLFNKFSKLGIDFLSENIHHRFHVRHVMEIFPEIKYSPFRDSFFRVFSSEKDMQYSFEDILDLCSVMSDLCPLGVKATWVFRMFDFDEDGFISRIDLNHLIDKITNFAINREDKELIVDILFNEIDLQKTNMLGVSEFVHAITKIEEFECIFSFKF